MQPQKPSTAKSKNRQIKLKKKKRLSEQKGEQDEREINKGAKGVASLSDTPNSSLTVMPCGVRLLSMLPPEHIADFCANLRMEFTH